MNALATGAGWLLGCPAPGPGPWPWCCSSPTHRLFLRDQPRRQQSWFPGLRSQAKGRPQDHPEATAGRRPHLFQPYPKSWEGTGRGKG